MVHVYYLEKCLGSKHRIHVLVSSEMLFIGCKFTRHSVNSISNINMAITRYVHPNDLCFMSLCKKTCRCTQHVPVSWKWVLIGLCRVCWIESDADSRYCNPCSRCIAVVSHVTYTVTQAAATVTRTASMLLLFHTRCRELQRRLPQRPLPQVCCCCVSIKDSE